MENDNFAKFYRLNLTFYRMNKIKIYRTVCTNRYLIFMCLNNVFKKVFLLKLRAENNVILKMNTLKL